MPGLTTHSAARSSACATVEKGHVHIDHFPLSMKLEIGCINFFTCNVLPGSNISIWHSQLGQPSTNTYSSCGQLLMHSTGGHWKTGNSSAGASAITNQSQSRQSNLTITFLKTCSKS